jgi:hypothetical protein
MRVSSIILPFAVLLVAGGAHAQAPSFTARLGRTTVGVGDTFPFEVTLSYDSGRMEDYRRPDFRGFRVLGEQPSQSTQIQMGGGGSFMRHTYSWTYQLAPLQKGKLTIGPASVRVDGRPLSTDKVTVNVVEAGQAPAPPQQRQRMPRGIPGFPGSNFFFPDLEPEEEPEPPPPPAAAGSGISAGRRNFLRVVPSKTKAFEGEQITVEWSLYLSGQQSNYAPSKEPRTDGFWVEDLDVPNQGGRLSLSQQMVDGRVYLTGPLLRKALFGLKPGKYTVTPLEADISRANFFGATVQSEHLKTDPLTFEILPLPPGAPAGFDTSAVGQFRLAAAIDRDHVQTGDAITLKLTLEGDGNLNKIPLPTLQPFPGWKIYDPKVSVELRRRDHISGSKTAEYLLLPEQPGETTIPSFAFSYFNPQKNSYATLRTEPIRVWVTGEARPQSAPAVSRAPSTPAGENLLAPEVRPIRNRAALRRDLGTLLYRSPVMLGIVLAPPGLLALVGLWGVARARMSQETESKRRRKLRRSANKRLRTASAYLQAGKLAPSLAEIERVLREFLTGKIGRTVAGMSHDELRAALEAIGAPKVLVDGTIAALDTCDRARFAPGSITPEEATGAIDRAGEIIEDFEKLRSEAGGAA